MDDSSRPDLSIVFANWNTGHLLRDCLHSITEKASGFTYETIVVDDGSTDGTVEMLGREFPGVRVLLNGRNIGVARSYNRGVAAATGRYVQILNTDMLLINNAPKILMDFLKQHPDVGACAGWLRNRDLTSQVSYGAFPSFAQGLTDALFLNELFPRAGFPNRGVLPAESISDPMEVEYVCGAGMVVHRELIEKYGFFDERYTSYCEETDFCYRVKHTAGLKVFFVPEAQIVHFGSASFENAKRYQIQLVCSSTDKFLVKHHGRIYSVCTRVFYAWYYFVKLIARFLSLAASSGVRREAKKKHFLNAWYMVRYYLFPNERRSGE